jgi:hypothetical protein
MPTFMGGFETHEGKCWEKLLDKETQRREKVGKVAGCVKTTTKKHNDEETQRRRKTTTKKNNDADTQR